MNTSGVTACSYFGAGRGRRLDHGAGTPHYRSDIEYIAVPATRKN